mmetsp:Transcript_12519/g.15421  ORF Transcript_12519/g.15421 Transcript_12519/m.15421 type:complete len:95 (+) Transcript_12519:426-710(+)
MHKRKEYVSFEQLTKWTKTKGILSGAWEVPVASSVNNTKPVHYLAMVTTELKCLEVEKNCYNVDTGPVEKLRFLRMTILTSTTILWVMLILRIN